MSDPTCRQTRQKLPCHFGVRHYCGREQIVLCCGNYYFVDALVQMAARINPLRVPYNVILAPAADFPLTNAMGFRKCSSIIWIICIVGSIENRTFACWKQSCSANQTRAHSISLTTNLIFQHFKNWFSQQILCVFTVLCCTPQSMIRFVSRFRARVCWKVIFNF